MLVLCFALLVLIFGFELLVLMLVLVPLTMPMKIDMAMGMETEMNMITLSMNRRTGDVDVDMGIGLGAWWVLWVVLSSLPLLLSPSPVPLVISPSTMLDACGVSVWMLVLVPCIFVTCTVERNCLAESVIVAHHVDLIVTMIQGPAPLR